jgi:hypothetical protein
VYTEEKDEQWRIKPFLKRNPQERSNLAQLTVILKFRLMFSIRIERIPIFSVRENG